MRRTLLIGKLHRLRVTRAERDYEGSIAIDARLLEAAGMREYERVDVYNVTNGERFSTYTILGEPGSGIVSVNGAAAHKAAPGDVVIVCAYGEFEEAEAAQHRPRLVYVDGQNRIARTGAGIPTQAA